MKIFIHRYYETNSFEKVRLQFLPYLSIGFFKKLKFNVAYEHFGVRKSNSLFPLCLTCRFSCLMMNLILDKENPRLNRKICFPPKVHYLRYNFLETIHKQRKREYNTKRIY